MYIPYQNAIISGLVLLLLLLIVALWITWLTKQIRTPELTRRR